LNDKVASKKSIQKVNRRKKYFWKPFQKVKLPTFGKSPFPRATEGLLGKFCPYVRSKSQYKNGFWQRTFGAHFWEFPKVGPKSQKKKGPKVFHLNEIKSRDFL